MPKSSKKRKDKAADFSKAKLKLGKGKQLATNAVDTSFKTRSIALPSQSIVTTGENGVPSTRRRLTLDDLLSHLKHYNSGTRKDALLGLRELLEAHPAMIEQCLTTLLNSCIRLISDEDASVRKSLLSFFKWLLPYIPAENIIPHYSLLFLFTTSAQTHIFPEIRVDATRFLDILLDHIPEVVVGERSRSISGHSKRVLEGFLGILNAGTKFGEEAGMETASVQATSTASVMLSTASKLIVLKTLSKFLSHALKSRLPSETSDSAPTWYFASSFATRDGYETFDAALRPSASTSKAPASNVVQWQAEVQLGEDSFLDTDVPIYHGNAGSWDLQELSDFASTSATLLESLQPDDSGDGIQQSNWAINLARTLRPTVVSIILDCSPVVFSPTSAPSESELGLLVAALDICHILYSSIFEGSAARHCEGGATADLKTILGYLAPYFPFKPSSLVKRDMKVEQAFKNLNLVFSELTSLLTLSFPLSSKGPTPRPGKARHASNMSMQKEIENAQAYSALLPSIWSLLNSATHEHEDMSDRVLETVIDHAIRAPSTSKVKRSTIEFLSRLVLLETEPQYSGSFNTKGRAGIMAKARQWIMHLPKVLWELDANDPATTEVALRTLLCLYQRHAPLLDDEVGNAICARLIPYFVIAHPTRGELPGPFTKIASPSLRMLVLDVAATIFILSGEKPELDLAIQKAVEGTNQKGYWAEVTGARTRPSSMYS
ncbi:hypothetical protein EVG20_g1081 [Dentipellis fragilis]|uniref:Pre-rRNA-processing protein n=1 Tax=Dentipellis fragilis TaxID=205917 RepID=A0A4Y9ZDS2_9AGAM|nr:hypothetical protein EVG20_g1081 [Dentipellis fragilis]